MHLNALKKGQYGKTLQVAWQRGCDAKQYMFGILRGFRQGLAGRGSAAQHSFRA